MPGSKEKHKKSTKTPEESFKVVVRCRPQNEKEKSEEENSEIGSSSSNKEELWPERMSSNTEEKKQGAMPIKVVKVWPERGAVQVYNHNGQEKLFIYDAVYDETADTQKIYNEMVHPVVSSVLRGFNGCVFAYGQTGTGKTHTMEGSSDSEGVIMHAFRHIWGHIEKNASPDLTYVVSCSYVELYLENVWDLLANKKKLTIRNQKNLNEFHMPDMKLVVCKSATEMIQLMTLGNKLRTVRRTEMNQNSSRSHTIFLVNLKIARRENDNMRVGKLNLVDLAGSERQLKTGAGVKRLKEASSINQALSSLGNVISALTNNVSHVPYRNSKLTCILKDSLGGNCMTLMIANITTDSYNYDETINTLRYAHRAKSIKNKPIRNLDSKDAM